MTVRTLRITEQRVAFRRLIIINRKKVWACESLVDAILKLSKRAGFTPDRELNSDPTNVARYVYKWHKDLAKAGVPIKLFENNRANGWRLTIPLSALRFETEPGGVPTQCETSHAQVIGK